MNGGSEWWNEEVGRRWPKREELLENGFREEIRLVTYCRYRAHRVVVKRAVQVAKIMADQRWGERLGNDFEGNKKDVLERGKASEER